MGGYIPAKYQGAQRGNPSLIVIHDMEAPEKGNTAEATARYFQTIGRPASAHYCIDNDSEVQCVPDGVVAYHAPGANRQGLGYEHAGYASQSADGWFDAYSRAMLDRSTDLAAWHGNRYNIPPRFLNAASLKAGDFRGVTTHHEVTQAFHLSTHTDPGPNFPIQWYVTTMANKMRNIGPPVTPPPPPASVPPAGWAALTEAIAYARLYATATGFHAFDGQGATANLAPGVTLIQHALNAFALTLENPLKWAVAESGTFDGRTFDLVKFFQVAHGLAGTGTVDGPTFGAMYP